MIRYLALAALAFLTSLAYFSWVKAEAEKALKSKKPGSFHAFLTIRILVAAVWIYGIVFLAARDPAALVIEVLAIFIGRQYAFKS
ncbi:MAG: hypothetical protein LBL52_01935 [Rickettsiales bacterium]|nr:hypothetical protein [Rickettsiales bacterium]